MMSKQKDKNEIKLTDNPLDNIKMMAPYLSEKQQYVTLGMIMLMVTENENMKVKAS